MRNLMNLQPEKMARIFEQWHHGLLDSHLIEITGNILNYWDEKAWVVVDQILDIAGQKGNGKLTAVAALEEGVPLTLDCGGCVSPLPVCPKGGTAGSKSVIHKAQGSVPRGTNDVFKSAEPGTVRSQDHLPCPGIQPYVAGCWNVWMEPELRRCSRRLHYPQCLSGKIKEACNNSDLTNLTLDLYFKEALLERLSNWCHIVAVAVGHGIPIPSLSMAFNYFEGHTTRCLPANLLQNQWDYFGAHIYERVDQPRETFFHTNWICTGGCTTSDTYTV